MEAAPVAVPKIPHQNAAIVTGPTAAAEQCSFAKGSSCQLSVDIDVLLFTVTAIAGKLMQLLADDKSTMEIRNRYQTLLGII